MAVPVTVVCASTGGLVSGSRFPIGTTDINCVATDVSGVSTPPTNLFDIIVRDTTSPVIGSVTNRIAEATSPLGAVVTYPAPSVTDAVSASLACLPASGTTFALGVTTVTCTADATRPITRRSRRLP